MIIIIGGIPGSGKTSLMYKIRKQIKEEPFFIKEGLIEYEFYPDHKVEIWGKYQNIETFAGTDKLSMAAQRDVPDHLKGNKHTILIEGDRFFNGKFFDSVADKKIIILEADEETIKSRLKSRKSNQSPEFLKSRLTKVNTIKKNYPHEVWNNNSIQEQIKNVKRIMELI